MSGILQSGQTVHSDFSGMPCKVERFLGGGGQGEVYAANLGGQRMALKWYFTHYLQEDPSLRERLEMAIKSGAPSDRFLWPMEVASQAGVPAFGYIMPLREQRFKGIVDMIFRRVEPSFRSLATTGFELAHSYLQLHAKGMCYRDISFGNVFFDPNTGEVRICDNDNVDVNGRPGAVRGTPRFMAPEIVRGDATPSRDTDLFSLAVLLFYMFMVHHPLDGKKESAIKCFDRPAMTKLYGTEPVFIFDPKDPSNEPIPGEHDNALAFWPIYPELLRRLFTRGFTEGLHDARHGRVQESEWRAAMVRLRDSIIYCGRCGSENFYDSDALKESGGKPSACWSCKDELRLPPRIRIGRKIVMLNYDTLLYPHHVDDTRMYDFSAPVAEVVRNPQNPGIWGLKNVSPEKWTATLADRAICEVEKGRSVTLAVGTKIQFGSEEGEIRT